MQRTRRNRLNLLILTVSNHLTSNHGTNTMLRKKLQNVTKQITTRKKTPLWILLANGMTSYLRKVGGVLLISGCGFISCVFVTEKLMSEIERQKAGQREREKGNEVIIIHTCTCMVTYCMPPSFEDNIVVMATILTRLIVWEIWLP